MRRTFALMFRNAVAEGVVPVNPCVLLPGDLPAKKDKDPKWRKTARFSRTELRALITDERIPEDRRAFWAVLFLGAMRFGEAAARRWRDYDATTKPLGKLAIETSYSTKKRREKDTKTEVPREMPVHPELAAILATWKATGWRAMMGREPNADAGREARQIDGATPPRRIAAVVEARMAFRFVDSPITCKLQVLQAPAPPEVQDNGFTPNAPGLHVVSVDCGQWSTTVRVFAVWPSLLGHPHFATVQTGADKGQERPRGDRWRILDALVNDRGFPADAFTRATPERPLPTGVSLQPFGG